MSDSIQKRARRRKTVTRVLVAAVVLAVGGFVAYRFMDREPAPSYRTAEATRGGIESSIVALGTVEPKDYVDVGAQVSGQLLRVHYDIGDFVQQGALLAEIDPTVAQSRVDADQAQLREMQANYRQQTANLKLARADAQRSANLLAADAISQAEAEASAAQLEVSEAQLAQLEAQMERLEFSLEEALANLNYTKIYAPMSGTVISQTTLEGQTINANQTAPVILRIADLTVMTVSADVSEADVPRLTPGMPAYFSTLGNPDRRWQATVRQVLPEPEVVNDVVLYKALLDVENEDRALLPQMSAQVSFVLGQVNNVVKVPAAALQISPMLLAQAGAAAAGPGGAPETPGEGEAPAMGAGGFGGGEDLRARMQNATPEEREAFRQRMQERMASGEFPGAGGGFGGGQGFGQNGQSQTATLGPRQLRDETILVITQDGLRARRVRVGLVSRTEAEVVSGLAAGETVVLGLQASTADNTGGGFRGPPGGFRPF